MTMPGAIPGRPHGCIFETCDFVSDPNRDHSACSGPKSLSPMLARHLKTSKLPRPYTGSFNIEQEPGRKHRSNYDSRSGKLAIAEQDEGARHL